jgi:nucleoside 2-deoxyribosyltransferase
MKEMLVYLAGPITGTNYGECNDWRELVCRRFANDDSKCKIRGISPMRGKAFLNKEKSIKDSYEDNSHCDKHAIFLRDKFDCLRADIVLANFLGAKNISIGSMFELAWAYQAGKYIVVVMEEKDNPHIHAFVRESAAEIFHDVDEAVDYIIDTFGR